MAQKLNSNNQKAELPNWVIVGEYSFLAKEHKNFMVQKQCNRNITLQSTSAVLYLSLVEK